MKKDNLIYLDHIPWSAIAGMRDKLIHDYFDVDIDVVWNTLVNEIPKVIADLENVIHELDQ